MGAVAGGISLFKSKNGGNIRARWGTGKNRVDWNTNTKDQGEALKRAVEELSRRTGSSAAPGTPTPRPAAAAPPSPQLPAGASPVVNGHGGRKPLGAALERVLAPPPAAGAEATPSVPASPAAVIPDAIIDPAKAAAAKLEAEAVEGVRHVHKVVGKSATYVLEGLLKRACRYAGREPEDMDDDEQALIREGCTEVAAKYLGKTKLTPEGKIVAGVICAGVGMYVGGKPIPKPPKVELKSVPADARPSPPQGGTDGGGGA
jgi:hypothetical protein